MEVYVCICPKGFSGDECEIPDTKISLLFHRDILLPFRSFISFHFIDLINNTLRIPDKSPKIICENDTSQL